MIFIEDDLIIGARVLIDRGDQVRWEAWLVRRLGGQLLRATGGEEEGQAGKDK
jgi:hypothetical protein